MNGKITTIETMGLVDGPGMRLVLFMAGCKLRCIYCHNPETWEEKNYTREITPDEVLSLYEKFEPYYGESGGVTFSGGEPLLQSDFLAQTIRLLKSKGIHTAIDTSGVGEAYEEAVTLADLIILDLKAVDEAEYKLITGRAMDEFNKFLKFVTPKSKKLWLRQVIVPGINDDEAHILRLKEFVKDIPNVEKIELLPYHTLGESKYKSLNLPYRLSGTAPMDKSRCTALEKLLKN